MTRRTRWTVAIAVVLLAVAVALVLWISMTGTRPDADGSPEPTPAASADADPLAQAQAALDAHLEQCTAEGAPEDVAPEGCGIRLPWGAEFASVSDVRFRIERMPEITLSADVNEGSRSFTADDGILVATVTGSGQDGQLRTETYRTDSWGVRGDVTVTGDAVDLTVW